MTHNIAAYIVGLILSTVYINQVFNDYSMKVKILLYILWPLVLVSLVIWGFFYLIYELIVNY